MPRFWTVGSEPLADVCPVRLSPHRPCKPAEHSSLPEVLQQQQWPFFAGADAAAPLSGFIPQACAPAAATPPPINIRDMAAIKAAEKIEARRFLRDLEFISKTIVRRSGIVNNDGRISSPILYRLNRERVPAYFSASDLAPPPLRKSYPPPGKS